MTDDVPKDKMPVKDLIAQSVRERSGHLNLRSRGLQEIPVPVFEMTWLRSLDLGQNRIVHVPATIGNLCMLETLDLWSNTSLKSIADEIGELSELKSLSIGPSSPRLPSTIGECRKLEFLAIGNNRLEELPDWLSSLRGLEELQAWGNWIIDLPGWLPLLSRLRILNLSRNGLSSFPPTLAKLARLENLDLSGNRFKSIPSAIGGLVNLQELNLAGNQLVHVPETLGNLRQLRILNLADNKLLSVPASLGGLGSLESLKLQNNSLHEVPDALAELKNLQAVNIRANRLSLPPGPISQWAKLRRLDLSRNSIVSIPSALGELRYLEYLHLEENELSDLPDGLSGLQSLRTVTLGHNRFAALPDVATKWTALEVLDLNSDPAISASHDQARTTVWSEKDSSEVRTRQSDLEVLPEGLRELPSLRVLLLFGHPRLRLPDELLGRPEKGTPSTEWDRDVGDLLDYYFRTRGGARPLNEAKLVLLGWGGAGKTSLVNRLVHRKFDPAELRTEGIEVTSWPVVLWNDEEARLNIWDFGGQEIMHATHQFFLTTRSLYLLVLNGRAGSADADLDYWMRIVDSFAPNSPVIVALNQIKKDPFELDENGLRQRYPNIRAFVKTDCAVEDGFGIDNLEATILDETDRLPDVRVNFPAAWFDIKNRLASMSENYLTFEHYREICSELGEHENDAQDQLANFLHSLGIALNYKDDHRLRDTHVLNPHWVTEGIYSILNSRLVRERKGEITLQDLALVLDHDRYPRERHSFLLDLMRKFELCFPYPEDESRYLVADLLPKLQPDEVDAFPIETSLQFEFRYPVLPEGLMPRFIVRSHIHSTREPRWRSGVILRWEQNRALVKADAPNRLVQIAVTGPPNGRRRLLAVVRSDFEHIHRSYRFKVDALVPVRIHPGLTVEYEKLLAAENAGMETFPEFFRGDFVKIDVAELLLGVNVEISQDDAGSKRQLRGARQPVKLFVSYSHRDEAHREALGSQLKVLQMAGLVEAWDDRRIVPGDDWNGEIDKALEEAGIVVLLVSPDFLASDYCNDVEVARALERHAEGVCRVVPVIVRDAQWKLGRLAAFQGLPTNGKPITTWRNVDTAWRVVGEGLGRVIQDLQTTRAAGTNG